MESVSFNQTLHLLTIYSRSDCNDNAFGPAIAEQCRSFDFTLYFEQLFLSLLPSTCLVLISPARIWQLVHDGVKVGPGGLRWLKLIATTTYMLLQLVLLVLWTLPSTTRTNISIAAALMSTVASVFIFLLSRVEHKRSLQPSIMLNIYLFFSTIFDSVQLRTLWMIHGYHTIAILLSASLTVKVTLLLLEGSEKRSILVPFYRSSTPEMLSSIYNRSVFWWLKDVLLTGAKRVLGPEDVLDLDPDLSSAQIDARAQTEWKKASKHLRHRLIWSTFASIKWPLLRPALPRALLIGLNYSQPFLLQRVVDYVGDTSAPSSQENRNIGYGLIGAAGLIYIGLAVINGRYKHSSYRSMVMVRGILISLIYQKTLNIKAWTSEDARAVTLMSTDVDAIVQSIDEFHEIWATLIEAGLAIYLLQRQAGIACIIPVFFALTSTAINTLWIGRKLGGLRRIWNEAIQKRIALVASTLQGMRNVKILGLSKQVESCIQWLRLNELQRMVGYRRMMIWMNLSSNLTGAFSAALVLTVSTLQAQAHGDAPLSPAKAYTILSILSLMTVPLQSVLIRLPSLMSSVACFGRIETYLLSDEKKDGRFPEDSHDKNRAASLSSQSGLELQTFSVTITSKDNTNIISLEKASIGFSVDKVVLSDLTAQIRSQSVTMIVGGIGSGKSSLLMGLLGELQCIDGSIKTKSTDIGYCQQSAWLTNDSIRNNIIGPRILEPDWFDAVIHACCLDADVELLPGGVDSMVGSRGLSLSGGQRQRISLARTVYARKSIVLLDDIFSALDAKTESKVFDRLFSPRGIFRKLGTTVILATHAVHFLNSADYIIALDDRGKIYEQGSFVELKSSNGYVDGLIQQLQHSQKSVVQDDESTFTSQNHSNIVENFASQAGELQSDVRRMGDWSVYKYYGRQLDPKFFALFLVFLGMMISCFNFAEVWIQWWTGADGHHTDRYIAVMITFGVVAMGSCYVAFWALLQKVVPGTGAKLHSILLSTIFSAPLQFFTCTDSGIILNRFSQDMTIVDGSLPLSLLQTILTIMQIFWNVGLLCYGAYYLTPFIPVLFLAVYFIQKFYLRTSRQVRLLDLEMKSPLFSHFSETIEGLATIRALGWQNSLSSKFLSKLDSSQRPVYLLYCIQRWLAFSLDILVACLGVLLVAFSTQFRNHTSSAAIGIAMLNVLSFSSYLKQLVEFWTQLETSIGAIARLSQLQKDVKPEESPLESLGTVPAGWPKDGSIQFLEVSASYDEHSKTVVRDVDLIIKSREKIGICGRTGSGKSTLVSLLFRLLPMKSGIIIVDGVDISTLPVETLRRSMIAIPQEPLLFSGTVRFNINPYLKTETETRASEVSMHSIERDTELDQKVIDVLSKVDLWDLISNRGGLSADMSSIGLSHGQKQLFCLARALFRKDCSISDHRDLIPPRILVLDEATSSVDIHSDTVMRQIISSDFADFTIITVAHRLSSLEECDRVLVMEDGRVVEIGEPAELMKRVGGFWRELQEA